MINAGDFVKLINKYKVGSGEISEDTMLINDTTYFNAVELSGNKAFIAYIQKENSKYYIKAVTCTTEGNTITLDNNITQILEVVYDANTYLIRLKENKVIIVYQDDFTYKFYVCEIIEGNIINLTADKATSTSTPYVTSSKFITLSGNKVVMFYPKSELLEGKVITIDSNNNVTVGKEAFINKRYSGLYYSPIKVSENKIIIVNNAEIDSYTKSISITPCIINEDSLAFRKFNTI